MEATTMRRRIEAFSRQMTATERRLAAALLADYPFAGLDTIQSLAEQTRVSAPTITRFVGKIGCRGYQDFQRRLIAELKEGQRSPVDLRTAAGEGGLGTLAEFTVRAARACEATGTAIAEAQFGRVVDLLGDDSRAVYVLGGRMSDAVALHLSRHLRQIRRSVHHLPSDPEQWPEYLLRMRSRDVLVLFDFRRYEARLDDLARMTAGGPRAGIVLVTDKWLSPVAGRAAEVLAVPIEIGTAWDSSVGAIALVEALIVAISERDWDATQTRIEAWDRLRPPHGKDG
ncbi:MAG: MurR/RpiR family transcriptional regulator [Pseudomonadota bacterium]